MPIAHLNIGSNQGDRQGNISLAVSLIDKQAGHVLAVSDPVESAPWGYDSPNPFINVGINIDTTLSPFDLLDTLQAIERQISPNPHRNPDGTYRDRVIDIDIILYGDVHITTPRLTIPHPLMHQRPFVLLPLRQLAPSPQQRTR